MRHSLLDFIASLIYKSSVELRKKNRIRFQNIYPKKSTEIVSLASSAFQNYAGLLWWASSEVIKNYFHAGMHKQ